MEEAFVISEGRIKDLESLVKGIIEYENCVSEQKWVKFVMNCGAVAYFFSLGIITLKYPGYPDAQLLFSDTWGIPLVAIALSCLIITVLFFLINQLYYSSKRKEHQKTISQLLIMLRKIREDLTPVLYNS